ncbi:unnamed protein product [Periconia digitata]|uniref:Uncharacterized protein n=1 Tax=Periconia digitata TaxID=1303443 RepID=A0A9W4XRZ8_9PLEO|nr:unnamed protein product [Periconia digitata]
MSPQQSRPDTPSSEYTDSSLGAGDDPNLIIRRRQRRASSTSTLDNNAFTTAREEFDTCVDRIDGTVAQGRDGDDDAAVPPALRQTSPFLIPANLSPRTTGYYTRKEWAILDSPSSSKLELQDKRRRRRGSLFYNNDAQDDGTTENNSQWVALNYDLRKCLGPLFYNAEVDRRGVFPILYVSDVHLAALSRAKKRKLMRMLAFSWRRVDYTITLAASPSSSSSSAFRILWRKAGERGIKHEVQGSYAAVLALTTALRGNHTLFAELLGQAPSHVIKELTPFLAPPLITLSNVQDLVYSGTQHIAHTHDGTSHERGEVARSIAAAIGTIIEKSYRTSTVNSNDDLATSLRSVIKHVLNHSADARDMACQVGLIAAGVERYILDSASRIDEKREVCNCIADVLFAAVGASANGGFAGGMAGPVVKEYMRRVMREKKTQLEGLRGAIKKVFEEKVYDPCLSNGRIMVENEDMVLVWREVDRTSFRNWYNEVGRWCDSSKVA